MKKMLTLLLALTLLFTMCACGNSSAPSAPSAPSKEPVTIRFMDNMASETRDALYLQLIEKFEKENPDIKIEYETVPWDESHSKLVTLGSAGEMPDVIQVQSPWISEFVNAGWIVPLENYLKTYEYADNFTTYTENILLNETQRDVYGEVYVIPDALLTSGMFVRKDLMDKAGIDYMNWTWEDYLSAAEVLTDSEAGTYGVSFRGSRGSYHQALFLLYSVTGGHVYDENGVCLFNSPECVDIFTKYVDIYKNGYAPKDAINWGFSEMVQGFTSGLTCMLNQTCEVIGMCEEAGMQDSQWTVAPLPKSAVDGKINAEVSFSNGYAISANSKNQDAAWKFIAFLSSPESAAAYGKTNLLIPVMKDALNDEFYSTGKMAGYAEMFRNPDLTIWPELGYFAEVGEFRETFADAEMQKCLLGQQTPQETLDNWANFLTTYQQQYMAENPDVPVPMPKDTSGLQ